VKLFIDQLYENKILTQDEYDDITGQGYFDFNLEEDLRYLKDLLILKERKCTDSSAEYEFCGIEGSTSTSSTCSAEFYKGTEPITGKKVPLEIPGNFYLEVKDCESYEIDVITTKIEDSSGSKKILGIQNKEGRFELTFSNDQPSLNYIQLEEKMGKIESIVTDTRGNTLAFAWFELDLVDLEDATDVYAFIERD